MLTPRACVRARYVILRYGMSTCQIEYLWRELIFRGRGTRTEEPNQNFWTCLDFFGGVWTFWTFLDVWIFLDARTFLDLLEKRKAPTISNAI